MLLLLLASALDFLNCFPANTATRLQSIHGWCFGMFYIFHLNIAETRARYCAEVNLCRLLLP